MTDIAAQRQASGLRAVAHALGNVLLGLAVGLLVYYATTDVDSRLSRRRARVDLQQLGAIASAAPAVVDSAPALDFDGWEEQDQAFWRSAPAGGVIGRLVIVRTGLDSVIVKGTDRRTLKRGPGWIVTTSAPGPRGNCAISGHRTTYLAPFRRLDRLEEGDLIELYTPYRRYRYRVTRSFAVRPWQVEVIAPTHQPTLTLTACHPPYSARYRLIVQSRLIEARPLENAPAAGTP